VQDPLAALVWPHLLAHIIELDASYAGFESTGGEDRVGLVAALRTHECSALTPRQRLDALCYLVDNTSQCETVRLHLYKNGEASLDLLRERRQLLEEELNREAAQQKSHAIIASLEGRLAEWQAQATARVSQSKKPLGQPPEYAEELRVERERAANDLSKLTEARSQRLAAQMKLDSMPLRSERLGTDRHSRVYIALSGATASEGLLVYTPAPDTSAAEKAVAAAAARSVEKKQAQNAKLAAKVPGAARQLLKRQLQFGSLSLSNRSVLVRWRGGKARAVPASRDEEALAAQWTQLQPSEDELRAIAATAEAEDDPPDAMDEEDDFASPGGGGGGSRDGERSGVGEESGVSGDTSEANEVEAGSWGWLEGASKLRELFSGLHPDGVREGALLRVMRRHRLRSVLGTADGDGGDCGFVPHPQCALTTVGRPAATLTHQATQASRGKTVAPIVPSVYRHAMGQGVDCVSDGAALAIASRLRALAVIMASLDSNSDARPITAAAAAAEGRKATEAAAEAAAAAAAAAMVGAGEVVDCDQTMHTVPLPPLSHPGRVLPCSEGVAAIAARVADGDVPPLPSSAAPQLALLRTAVREFEDRLVRADVAWSACPSSVSTTWRSALSAAIHPAEVAACLRVLDAHLAPFIRSRSWGLERASRWRVAVLRAATTSAVAWLLCVLDDTCAWEILEKQQQQLAGITSAVAKPTSSRSGGGRASVEGRVCGGAQALRARQTPAEFASVVGEPAPAWLEFCESAPSAHMLRATVLGRLVNLTPTAPCRSPLGPASELVEVGGAVGDDDGGGWTWVACGVINEGSPADLKGLTVAEAKGGRMTVWYEETHADRYTHEDAQIDVPYTGVVLGVHYRDGLSVRFEDTVDAEGKPERIHITNDDDWAWGLRQTKAATLTLGDSSTGGGGKRELHSMAMLI